MSSFEGNISAPSGRTELGQFKCICCGVRYWKKNKLIRRAAQCRGVRYSPGNVRWKCKAWRCRFNDQCSEASAPCPICGAFKPPEFQSLQPADASDQSIPIQSAPHPDAACEPANPSSSSSSSNQPAVHHPSQSGPLGSHVSDPVFQSNLPDGIVTLLPLLEGMTQRYLTDV